MSLEILRRRASALADACTLIEAEFGSVADMIVERTGVAPSVPLEECAPYGFGPDLPANGMTLDPWEILLLLHALRDRYASDVLATAERGAA